MTTSHFECGLPEIVGAAENVIGDGTAFCDALVICVHVYLQVILLERDGIAYAETILTHPLQAIIVPWINVVAYWTERGTIANSLPCKFTVAKERFGTGENVRLCVTKKHAPTKSSIASRRLRIGNV